MFPANVLAHSSGLLILDAFLAYFLPSLSFPVSAFYLVTHVCQSSSFASAALFILRVTESLQE